MRPSTDPAVTAIESALRRAEGPFTVLSRYYTNPDVADVHRRRVAECFTRAVDRVRAATECGGTADLGDGTPDATTAIHREQLSLVLEAHA